MKFWFIHDPKSLKIKPDSSYKQESMFSMFLIVCIVFYLSILEFQLLVLLHMNFASNAFKFWKLDVCTIYFVPFCI